MKVGVKVRGIARTVSVGVGVNVSIAVGPVVAFSLPRMKGRWRPSADVAAGVMVMVSRAAMSRAK